MIGLRLQPADIRLAAIFVILAVLAALITWLFAPASTEGSFRRQPSTFFNTGYGTKAFYLSLNEMKFDARRVRHRLTWEQLHTLDGLVILEPIMPLDSEEQRNVMDWVFTGGTLLLAPGEAGVSGLGLGFVSDSGRGAGAQVSTDDSARRAGSNVVDDSDWADPELDRDHPVDPLLQGVTDLELGESLDRLEGINNAVLQAEVGPLERVHGDHVGAYIVRVHCGQGQIILLADVYPLTNLGISKKDNAVLAANLALALATDQSFGAVDSDEAISDGQVAGERDPGGATEAGLADDDIRGPGERVLPVQARPVWEGGSRSLGTIGFDEYHLGFSQRDTRAVAMAMLVLKGPYAWAATQAAVVGLIALLAGAWRFGKPRDLPPIRRRHRADFARAAGHLLREAREGPRRLAVLADHHRTRWCKLVHLPAHTRDEALAEAVETRCGEQVGPLLEATDKLRMQDTLDDSELLSLAQALQRVTEVLEHGTASRR